MIKAETHSDDRAVEVDFDATPYFQQASDEDLASLIECGFEGDEPADQVAIHLADTNDQIAAMFTYLEARNRASRKSTGFEVSVDEDEALDWLKQNRPSVFNHIDLAEHDLAKCDKCGRISDRDDMQKTEKQSDMLCDTCTAAPAANTSASLK